MLWTVEGTFKDGKVELSERPQDVREAKVLVTFLAPAPARLRGQIMQLGQFAGPEEKQSTDDRSAEWRGSRNDDT
jgi:hypothetical protein